MKPLKPYLNVERPHILAHRGLHTHVPENTLAAFSHAIKVGATHLETDAHVSKDGVAILVHDPEITVAGNRLRVAELTATELNALDLGAGEGVPSLELALSAFPAAKFNIDIKVSDAADAVAAAVIAADAQDRVLIASFKAARRTSATRHMPGVVTSASASVSLASVLCATVGLSALGRFLLAKVDAVQLPTTMLGLPVFTKRFVVMCHQAGVAVHAWTINNPHEMQLLLDAGVDGIVTDRCDLAQSVCARTHP